MTTRVTQSSGTDVTTHEINFTGLAGGVFWATLAALIVFIISFATNGWYIAGTEHVGLWETCTCPSMGDKWRSQDWFRATQAMMTIALILMCIGIICLLLYLFIHSVKLNMNLEILIFVATFFGAFICSLIGIIIFGAYTQSGHNYSFAFAIIAAIIMLIAAILGVIQMRKGKAA